MIELVSKGMAKLTDPGNAASSPTGVTAEIELVDDGEALRVSGAAYGLTPGVPYVSLIYDVDSSPDGAHACEPGVSDPSDPNFITPTMFIARWDLDETGGGTLSATKHRDDQRPE